MPGLASFSTSSPQLLCTQTLSLEGGIPGVPMKTLLKTITTLENRSGAWACVALATFALALCLVWTATPIAAQTAGEGSLEGTVMDNTGAVIPHAAVTITNDATGIKTVSEASSAGFFDIAPVLPGSYTVEVSAKGFKTLVQDNVVIDAMQVRTISPKLEIGVRDTDGYGHRCAAGARYCRRDHRHDRRKLNLYQPAHSDERKPARSHGLRSSHAGRAECQ